MKKEEFKHLFYEAVQAAIKRAERRLGRDLPTNIVIELHGAGHQGGRCLDIEQTAAELYLGSDRFYRIVDISVVKIGTTETIVFVRASAHPPGGWDETYNDPPGMGPFKLLDALEIKTFV